MAASDQEVFASLDGAGRHLLGHFQGLTEAQRQAIPSLLARNPVLLVAPTASGKTEAVLAPLLALLARERWPGRPSILYITPTRALVNDLFRRLQPKLTAYVEMGRRTAEHGELDCQLLVTTPESLDSMLCRGMHEGSHYLANVRAIVLDELHLLAESARGTQLQVLLSRLDEVTGEPVLRAGLSATVPAPNALATRFLGRNALVAVALGGRALRVDRAGGDGPLPDRGEGVDPLVRVLWRSDPHDGYARLAERLLAVRDQQVALKGLVFVPSRARCDRLTADLRRAFAGRAPVQVWAHHGSLDQVAREAAERSLAQLPESVAVATSTLEVGIDIGDIGVVVLDGPPGSVSSLLQRVGRGSRRSREVFVIPVVHNEVEACTVASMLRAAIAGELDEVPETDHKSVSIQQLASILFQSSRGYRTRQALEHLLSAAFGERTSNLVERLLEAEWVRIARDGLLGPGDRLRELMDQPMRLHANIGGSGSMVPLVDAVTGEPLAWVPRSRLNDRVVLAGSSYLAQDRGDRIELAQAQSGGQGNSIRYASRAAPLGRTPLRHLCRGLGLPDTALVHFDGEYVHFGGALFGRLLTLCGVDSGPVRSSDDPRRVAGVDVLEVARRSWDSLEALCGFGPFQRSLPLEVRREAVVDTVRNHDLPGWIASLRFADAISADQTAILVQA